MIVTDFYKAVAQLQGGQQIQEFGSFDKVAKWCDDVIRANEGDVSVTIRYAGKEGERK